MKEKIKEISSFHKITVYDLQEDDLLFFDNGLYVRYIGEVDLINSNLLFKTLYSPFSTTKWISLSKDKLSTKNVIIIR